ncbi:hypothetical protein PIB30_076769 [Stylosanthes scabra]|uniref:PB1-like domain-containing protein n=1 Tax=Stylosanthes scabra TaxID=79078 RepID=A0ABU6SSF8_9FABA|nr:hypothetical protein [Stylosanthes scabra]
MVGLTTSIGKLQWMLRTSRRVLRFERFSNGDRHYVDRKVTRFQAMDVDLVNKEDLVEFAKDIGYINLKCMLWHEHTLIKFEAGLHSLAGDMEINDMCEYTLNNNLKEFHIYLDHLVDVPIMPGPNPVVEPIVVDSSSYGSYESAEDEAYNPLPPGYESDSSGSSSPKKPIRKKIVTPKKKKMHLPLL